MLKSYKDTKYHNVQGSPRVTENHEEEMKGTGTAHTHSALVRHQPLLHMSACSFFKLPESFIRYVISLKRMLKHKRVEINWQKVTQLVSDRAVIHILPLNLSLR